MKEKETKKLKQKELLKRKIRLKKTNQWKRIVLKPLRNINRKKISEVLYKPSISWRLPLCMCHFRMVNTMSETCSISTNLWHLVPCLSSILRNRLELNNSWVDKKSITIFSTIWITCLGMPVAKFRKRISFILLIICCLLLNLRWSKHKKYLVGLLLVIIEDWIKQLKKKHRLMVKLFQKNMAILTMVRSVIQHT